MTRPYRSRARKGLYSIAVFGASAVATLLLTFLQGGTILIPRAAEAATVTDSYSTRELNPDYIEIRRKKYKFRHWKWSGIFPLYGGWIQDPHFVEAPVLEFSPEIQERLGDPEARCQGFDVNPWFEDDSSEIVLAVESGGVVFEYVVEIPDGMQARYGFSSGFSGENIVVPFLYRDSLAFFTVFSAQSLFLVVDLPLSKDQPIRLYREDSNDWNHVVEFLRRGNRYKALKQNLCVRHKSYRKLYEKFESCGEAR